MSDARLYERVERRAFELWEQDGRPEGRALDEWLRAEAEIVAGHDALFRTVGSLGLGGGEMPGRCM